MRGIKGFAIDIALDVYEVRDLPQSEIEALGGFHAGQERALKFFAPYAAKKVPWMMQYMEPVAAIGFVVVLALSIKSSISAIDEYAARRKRDVAEGLQRGAAPSVS